MVKKLVLGAMAGMVLAGAAQGKEVIRGECLQVAVIFPENWNFTEYYYSDPGVQTKRKGVIYTREVVLTDGFIKLKPVGVDFFYVFNFPARIMPAKPISCKHAEATVRGYLEDEELQRKYGKREAIINESGIGTPFR